MLRRLDKPLEGPGGSGYPPIWMKRNGMFILRFKIKWKNGGQIHETWHIHTDGYFQTNFSFLHFSSKFQLPHLTNIHAELLYWFLEQHWKWKTWEKPFWNFTKKSKFFFDPQNGFKISLKWFLSIKKNLFFLKKAFLSPLCKYVYIKWKKWIF